MKELNNLKSFNSWNNENLFEDTSATGGPAGAVTGGGIVNSQPSSLPGVTVNPTYTNTGGLDGSGDTSVAGKYLNVTMGQDHGPRTGKKPRLSLKALKNVFSKKQDFTANQGNVDRKPKVMDFDSFQKADLTQIKK